MRPYKIVAHRGASAYEPENTIRAIIRAIDFGADMAEVDVHSTKDDKLVVIHDATVDRTTNGRGVVKEMTLKEIRELDAGKGEKIPTLQEVLSLSKDRIGVMVEIKEVGIEKLLVELLKKKDASDRVVITSFMTDAIKKIKELDSRILTGQIFSQRIPDIAKKGVKLKVTYMLPQYELVTQEIVEELHTNGLSLFTWTINSRSIAERLIKLGVDGIITNKPDLLLNRKMP